MYSFGLSARNLAVAAMMLNDDVPPRISVEETILRIAGFFSCRYWNGGDEKLDVISVWPPSIAAVASGCAIDTVSGSSFVALASPNSFIAAICSSIACIDTLTAGITMRSFSVKSLIDFTLGLRVMRNSGSWFSPDTPRTSMLPRVLAQIVAMPGMPRHTKSTEPEISASFITSDERNCDQATVTSPRPAFLASASISFWSSMMKNCR